MPKCNMAVRVKLLEYGYSQADLARYMHTSQSRLSSYLRFELSEESKAELIRKIETMAEEQRNEA